jgi:hypothetical protein
MIAVTANLQFYSYRYESTSATRWQCGHVTIINMPKLKIGQIFELRAS